MMILADRWPLTMDGRDEPICVEIVKAGPSSVTIKKVDFGYERDTGQQFTLATPIDDRLRPS